MKRRICRRCRRPRKRDELEVIAYRKPDYRRENMQCIDREDCDAAIAAFLVAAEKGVARG